MRSARLVATDLDGTLVRTDGTISRRSRDAFAAAEEAGIAVALVTGRPPRWMRPVAEATGHHGVAVCANGAILYDLHTERIVAARTLATGELRDVVDRLRREVPGLAFALEYGADFGHEPAYVHNWDIGDVEIRVGELDTLLDRPVVKLLARHPTMGCDELLAAGTALLGSRVAVTASSHDALLEISAAGVTKATGLAALAERAGVPAAEVVAVGDMPNDLPMLAWAGHAVAVANAHPSVLAAVDEVAPSNDDDGVAHVVERLVTAAGGTVRRPAVPETSGPAGPARAAH